jgi:sporulation protein YlmC with PRC-barrel domain
METKRIRGLQVITLAGVKAGTVDQIFFDPATKHVAGFVLQADPARTADAPPRFLDADDVHALGADALIVPDDGAIRDPQTGTPLATLVDMNELAKRQVVTEGGTWLGQVAAIELDPKTLQLARVELSAGFFTSNRWIPAAQVIRFGADAVMVADAIAAPAETTATPVAAEPAGLATS